MWSEYLELSIPLPNEFSCRQTAFQRSGAVYGVSAPADATKDQYTQHLYPASAVGTDSKKITLDIVQI